MRNPNRSVHCASQKRRIFLLLLFSLMCFEYLNRLNGDAFNLRTIAFAFIRPFAMGFLCDFHGHRDSNLAEMIDRKRTQRVQANEAHNTALDNTRSIITVAISESALENCSVRKLHVFLTVSNRHTHSGRASNQSYIAFRFV